MHVSEDFYKEDALETVGGPLGHLEDEPLDPRYFSAAMWEEFYEDIALEAARAAYARASYEAQRTRAEQLTFELSGELSKTGGSR